MSPRQIAAELDKGSITTALGKSWTGSAVARLHNGALTSK